MRTAILIIILFLTFSCKKESPEILSNFTGDYHLSYIKVSDVDFWTPEDISYNTGLRVQDNNQVHTYVDGELFKKYSFEKIVNQTEERIDVLYKKSIKEKVVIKFYKQGKMELTDFPFPNKTNVFHQ